MASSPELTAQARSIVIGTAGHIDHGKTALVRALTGIDTDRLPEEKRRGITIDLGFASLETCAPNRSPLSLSFIDVPGHARFVRNMLAGAAGIDAVLLVISAEEGVKPQTEEHLAICTLLGIERGITVLTKADLVANDRLQSVSQDVSAFLSPTFLRSAPILPVSVRSGVGIEALRNSLIQLASIVPSRKSDAPVRLPIDRVFTMKGFGTVVTGTLMGGSIRTGDELAIEPGRRDVKVRGIQVHGHAEQIAYSGSRAALNLARVETSEVNRGDILVAPSSVLAVDRFDAEITLLPGARLLKHRARVHFHALASECLASTTLFDAATLEAGRMALARLRLSQPIVLLPGDRFVLRQGTPLTTIGGGRILDAHPLQQSKKSITADWLRHLNGASLHEQVRLRIERRGASGILRRELVLETGTGEGAFGPALERLKSDGQVRPIGAERLIASDSLNAVRTTIANEFQTRVRTSVNGIKRSEFRGQLRFAPEIFDHVVLQMEREGELRVSGDSLLPTGTAASAERDGGALARVAAEFERTGITPPAPDELGERLKIPAAEIRRLITLLLRDGTLVRLGSDSLCMDRKALEVLSARVRALRGQTLDVAAFKQLAGVSRKYAIPLLEYLDRQRITVKQGDRRLVL